MVYLNKISIILRKTIEYEALLGLGVKNMPAIYYIYYKPDIIIKNINKDINVVYIMNLYPDKANAIIYLLLLFSL